MDTLVFDIETKNFFTDPGVGRDNFEALEISVVGVYSYAKNEYFIFDEYEMPQLAELFRGAQTLIGFALNRFDVPVLNAHFQRLPAPKLNLWAKERIDMLEIIERVLDQRISLSKLAQANLGVSKNRHGGEAIGLYARGEMKELKEYCLNDVKLTRELYDRFRTEGELLVPDKVTGTLVKVAFPVLPPQTATLW